MAQVSCQNPLSDDWLDNPVAYDKSYARAQEPDTKGLIPPAEARRMSKILKRTVATAITALDNSGIHQPDAIITGTGMGCMENSEKFLIDLCTYGESCLKPTLFMQSTHNTISSLIAIILKCHGYNNTYSHKGLSFESALLDAWLQIKEGLIRNALVGAHDEATPFLSLVLERTHPEYSFVSETSMSAVLSGNENDDNICEIEDVRIFHRPDLRHLASLLSEEKDSVLMIGTNGNPLNDQPYEELIKNLDYSPRIMQYKNIFGENFSSSAMAFYSAARILEKGETDGTPLRRITILNHSESIAWSVVRIRN